MSANEAQETFFLICNSNSLFVYREWIMDNFPSYRQFLSAVGQQQPRADSSLTVRENSQFERSLRIEDSLAVETDPSKLA